MKLQAALVAGDPLFLHWLQDAMEGVLDWHLIDPGESSEHIFDELSGISRVNLICLHVSERQSRCELIERLTESMPETPIVAVGSDGPADLVIDVMRAGARDFLIYGRDDQELRTRLGQLLRRAAGTPGDRPDATGRVIAMLNANPDESLGFAAGHLALAAHEAARSGERILLIDAAMPYGATLVFSNTTQSYSLLDGTHDVHRCDQTLVDTAFSRDRNGLYLLSLPEDLVGPTPLDAIDFLELLEVLRGFFRRIFVAASSNLPLGATAGLVRKAHACLLVSDPSILHSRANKHLLKALRLDGCPLERTGLVVDQPGHRPGLEPDNLAGLLELPLWGTLGGSFRQRTQAMDAGESLFDRAPRDQFCTDIRLLSDRLRADDPARARTVDTQPGLFDRLFRS